MEERKAECFAASMLLTGVDRYFIELPEMDFVSKIFHCMSAFQAPYKAVLVSLYEYALQSENETLKKRVLKKFLTWKLKICHRSFGNLVWMTVW